MPQRLKYVHLMMILCHRDVLSREYLHTNKDTMEQQDRKVFEDLCNSDSDKT